MKLLLLTLSLISSSYVLSFIDKSNTGDHIIEAIKGSKVAPR